MNIKCDQLEMIIDSDNCYNVLGANKQKPI